MPTPIMTMRVGSRKRTVLVSLRFPADSVPLLQSESFCFHACLTSVGSRDQLVVTVDPHLSRFGQQPGPGILILRKRVVCGSPTLYRLPACP